MWGSRCGNELRGPPASGQLGAEALSLTILKELHSFKAVPPPFEPPDKTTVTADTLIATSMRP